MLQAGQNLATLYALARKIFSSRWVRRGLFVLLHVAAICVSYYVCFLIRFDGRIPEMYLALFTRTLPLLLIISVLVFRLMNLYEGLWTYFSIDDLLRLTLAQMATMLLFATVFYSTNAWSFQQFPRSIFFMEFIFLVAGMGGFRIFVRLTREFLERGSAGAKNGTNDRFLLVG